MRPRRRRAAACARSTTCPRRPACRSSATCSRSIAPASISRSSAGRSEYGPYFRFQLGSRRILAIADHAAMGTLLRDRPDGFRRTKKLAEISAEIGSAVGVFGAEGEAWKRQRRMVMAGFDPRHLRAYFPSLVKVSERLAGRWGRAADAGAPIDLQADLMRYTVDTVAGLAFGAEVNTLESDDDVIQQHLDKIFPAIFRRMFAPLPTWRWWKSARRPRARPQRRRGRRGDPGLHRRRARPARGPGAARRAEEPARGDDRRRRRSAVGHHAERGRTATS